MELRKHLVVPKASRYAGLAMTLGVLGLAAPLYASPAVAAPAGSWTAYVVNTTNNTVTPFDTSTNTAGTPIAVGNMPEGIAITPNGSTAYVTNYADGTVTPINTATNTAGPPIAVGTHPYGIAITPNGTTAYVTNITNVGTVTPIDIATNTVGTPIPAGAGPAGIAITPNGTTAYVVDSAGAAVTPINTSTNTAGTPIEGFGNVYNIAITPNGATAYVANRDQSTVTALNTSTNTIGNTIPVGWVPGGVAVAPNGSTAYVTTSLHVVTPQDITNASLTPINTATDATGTPITLAADSPTDIAITPDGATAYVIGDGVFPVNLVTGTAGSPLAVPASSAIAITPDQAPVAQLAVAPGEVGQPTDFDASASTVAVGTITKYAWNFGDGSTATTSASTTTHTYAAAGPYTATVTETDSAGTSTTQVFTGRTMSNNGGPSAVASQNFTVPESSPTVLVPSNAAMVSGSTYLDGSAPNATGVEFLLFGGAYGYDARVLCTATLTEYGWVCDWNTTTVPNGSYIVVSEATYSSGSDTFSPGVHITVKNPLPSTSVLIPSNGASLSGSAYLDASASYASGVKFLLFGGPYGYSAPVICTTTLTDYGWLCDWDSSTVPNGSYVLVSVANNEVGTTFSKGVSISVKN